MYFQHTAFLFGNTSGDVPCTTLRTLSDVYGMPSMLPSLLYINILNDVSWSDIYNIYIDLMTIILVMYINVMYCIQ